MRAAHGGGGAWRASLRLREQSHTVNPETLSFQLHSSGHSAAGRNTRSRRADAGRSRGASEGCLACASCRCESLFTAVAVSSYFQVNSTRAAFNLLGLFSSPQLRLACSRS